jgi:hypothetical protein
MAMHTIDKAKSLGAWAGNPENRWLWTRSKRELVEMVFHLAALSSGDGADHGLSSGAALARAKEEHAALKARGMI